MKIGFYCESPADREAMKVFVEGILGEPPEPINMDLEARPQPQFFTALGGVFRGLYYNSDAEGLVLVPDADDTAPHCSNHEPPGQASDDCRLCQVRKIITKARDQLKPRADRHELKIAVGLAVPAIEAWYLVGKHHQVGEAAWLTEGMPRLAKPHLKKLVYGTERPPLGHALECAVKEARRLIANLTAIENAFPAGFRTMAETIRSWKVAAPTP